MEALGSPSSCLIVISAKWVDPKYANPFPTVRNPWSIRHPSGGRRIKRSVSPDHRLNYPLVVSPRFLLHSFDFSINGSVVQDAVALGLVLVGAYSLVRSFESLTEKGFIGQKLSRKMVHILSGLLFMSSWPLFSSSMEARFVAAVVPLTNFLRLLVHGLSLVKDERLVKSVTREGKPEELLRGPLYYVLILMFSALFFWRESPVGVISLAMMCAGDGVADIMGRRFGIKKLPYNEHKSWVGSISMFTFGMLSSLGMLFYFHSFGYFPLDWGSTASKVATISLAATIMESLPVTEIVDDNVSVPLTSMLMAMLLFGSPLT